MDMTTFAILLALMPQERTAGAIREAMSHTQPGNPPPLASFYRHMKRSLDAGWVTVAGEIQPGTPGRPSQTYQITAAGRRAVRAEARRLQHLAGLALDSGRRGSS